MILDSVSSFCTVGNVQLVEVFSFITCVTKSLMKDRGTGTVITMTSSFKVDCTVLSLLKLQSVSSYSPGSTPSAVIITSVIPYSSMKVTKGSSVVVDCLKLMLSSVPISNQEQMLGTSIFMSLQTSTVAGSSTSRTYRVPMRPSEHVDIKQSTVS